MDKLTEREEFEKWISSYAISLNRSLGNDNYMYAAAEYSWRAWQARALLEKEECEHPDFEKEIETFGPNEDGVYTSGINNIGVWGNQIECHAGSKKDAEEIRDLVFTALVEKESATSAVPEGWKLMPIDLPIEMIDAVDVCVGAPCCGCSDSALTFRGIKEVYDQLLIVSPTPPAKSEPSKDEGEEK